MPYEAESMNHTTRQSGEDICSLVEIWDSIRQENCLLTVFPCLIDNVVDTGTTAKAAAEALGNAMVLSFAMSDALLQREKHIGFKR